MESRASPCGAAKLPGAVQSGVPNRAGNLPFGSKMLKPVGVVVNVPGELGHIHITPGIKCKVRRLCIGPLLEEFAAGL